MTGMHTPRSKLNLLDSLLRFRRSTLPDPTPLGRLQLFFSETALLSHRSLSFCLESRLWPGITALEANKPNIKQTENKYSCYKSKWLWWLSRSCLWGLQTAVRCFLKRLCLWPQLDGLDSVSARAPRHRSHLHLLIERWVVFGFLTHGADTHRPDDTLRVKRRVKSRIPSLNSLDFGLYLLLRETSGWQILCFGVIVHVSKLLLKNKGVKKGSWGIFKKFILLKKQMLTFI